MSFRKFGAFLAAVTFLSAASASATSLHFDLSRNAKAVPSVRVEANEGGVTAKITGLKNYQGQLTVDELLAYPNNRPFAAVSREVGGLGVISGRPRTHGAMTAFHEGFLVQIEGAPEGFKLERLVLGEQGHEREPIAIYNLAGEKIFTYNIPGGTEGYSNRHVNLSGLNYTENAFILTSTVEPVSKKGDRGFRFRSLIASYDPEVAAAEPAAAAEVSAVPVPGALGLLMVGAGGLVFAGRKKRH